MKTQSQSLRTWLHGNALAVAAGFIFVVIAVDGLISHHELATVVQRFEAVRRSSNTLAELGETITPLRDAAAGQRNFLLTGRPEYLQPFYSGRTAIAIHLRRLEALTDGNPVQRKRVRNLGVAIDGKLSEIEETLAKYRTQGPQAAMQDVLTGHGGDQMTTARRIAQAIQMDEERSRTLHRAAATRSSERATVMTVLTSVVAALLLVLILGQIGRTTRAEQHARERAEAAHAAEIKARMAADTANRVKDEFIATVSHELRTPLTAILGWSQVLADTEDRVELKEGLQAIHSCAIAQKRLIDDLLDVARIMSGKMRLSIRTINIAEVTRAGVDSVRPAAEAKGIKLAVHVDERIRMAADPDRLQQVVWNLVANAVKFTPRGGAIDVRVQRSESHAVISVSDSGEGITADFLPHVFEPFRQADASKAREHKGLGLGLGIVKSLVEAHGGTIRVSSGGKGQGATFLVALPIMPFTRDFADGGDPVTESPDDDWPIVLPDRDALAGMTILAVDDHKPTLDLLTSVLRHSGANVLAAPSAADGYKLLRSFKPDLVLSDIGMPVEDGFALVDRIRALPPESGGSTPAIALTAYVRDDDRMKVLTRGFQAYFAKPIEPVALVNAIREVVSQHYVAVEPGGERPEVPPTQRCHSSASSLS
jgi:signal transduction histidine kinase/ActR/RegA family two-component response regulator